MMKTAVWASVLLTCTLGSAGSPELPWGPEPKPGPGPEPKPDPGPDGNPALDFIEGLAHGVFDDDTLANCIGHVSDTVPSVASSLKGLVTALKSKNPIKIGLAIKAVRTALKDVPQQLQDCGANLQDVKDFLGLLEEVVPSIFRELASAHESLEHQNYEDFGEHLGKTLRLLTSDGPGPHALQDPEPEPKPGPGPDGNPALETIIGLSDGLFDDHTFSECLANVLQGIPEAKSALSDLLSALKSKNPFKVAKAVKELKQVAQSIPDSLKSCSDNVEDVMDLLNTVKLATTTLVDDLAGALSSLKAHDYYDFGAYLGNALSVVVYGEGPEPNTVVV